MKKYTQEEIEKAKRIDLLKYLLTCEAGELVRLTKEEYTTKTHSSLKISNGLWHWWKEDIGGRNALDYLIKVRNIPFNDAVGLLLDSGILRDETKISKRPPQRKLLLPNKADGYSYIKEYLISRGISETVIDYFIDKEMIYESSPMHSVVFVGFDNEHKPKYGGVRGIGTSQFKGDCNGSEKAYSFRNINAEADNLHIFESSIDLLSHATLMEFENVDWTKQSLLSMAGVSFPSSHPVNDKVPISLDSLLQEQNNIKKIYLHLDNDEAGKNASVRLKDLLEDRFTVIDDPPPYGKDVNEYLCQMLGISLRKILKKGGKTDEQI